MERELKQIMRYYYEDKERVLQSLDSCGQGLSDAEAAARLERNGRNKLKEAKKESLLSRFFNQLKDPMIIILIAAAIVSGVVSVVEKESFSDTIIIIAVVLLNAVLGVYQESKAEKAIEALQAMSSATSRVLRGGMVRLVKSEELVVGDVVLLEAGRRGAGGCEGYRMRKPAGGGSRIDGRSVPVNKQVETIEDLTGKECPLGDRVNMVYMGSTIVYGRGYAVITATGMGTEMGKIADALTKAESGQTPLQIKLGQLSRILTYIVIGICIFMFGFSLLTAKSGITPELVLNTFMVAVSLAVAAIPEGLATVVTISLSIGVTKMSRRNAVIRKLTAVETLGCAQVICSDKTGTLTQNRMTVVRTAGRDEKLLATAMSLCSDAEPDETEKAVGEPTECALVNFATALGLKKPALKAEYPRIAEAPVRQHEKAYDHRSQP